MDIAFILRWRVYRIPIPFSSLHSKMEGLQNTNSFFNLDKISKEIFKSKFFVFGFSRGASVSAAARRGASLYLILYTGDWRNLGFFKRFFPNIPWGYSWAGIWVNSTLKEPQKNSKFLIYNTLYIKFWKWKLCFLLAPSLLLYWLIYVEGWVSFEGQNSFNSG